MPPTSKRTLLKWRSAANTRQTAALCSSANPSVPIASSVCENSCGWRRRRTARTLNARRLEWTGLGIEQVLSSAARAA